MELQKLDQDNREPNQNGRPFIPSSQGMNRFRAARYGVYQLTKYDKFIMVIMIILDCALLLLSLGALFVGFLLVTYRGSYADLCDDDEWFDAAICVLIAGFALLGITILCFVAIHKKSSFLIKIFILLLVLFFMGELTIGIYTFARRDFIESRFRVCMKDAYQKDYMDPSKKHVTEAWDLFQERFHCCGVDDSYDFRSNNKIGPNGPKSCGGTLADARSKQPCFEIIKREVLDNFHIIGGSIIGIAGVQLVSIVVAILLLRVYYKREEYE